MKTLQIVQSFLFSQYYDLCWLLAANLFRPGFHPSARPPEVRRLTFLVYSLNLLHKVTHILRTLACNVALSAYTALILSSYSSSHDFATHFLHFHLTMDSLCFANGWLICTPITDFHRQVKHHARRTLRNAHSSEWAFWLQRSLLRRGKEMIYW